jgi:hypothetical protein
VSVEAAASLRLWAVTIELGGQEYTIPPRPASDWVVAVLDATDEVFPTLALLEPDDYEAVKDRILLDQAVTFEEVAEVSQQALAAVSGWKWWTAQTLIFSAAKEWRLISGEMTKRGLDPGRLPLGAWLNGLYAMATEKLDQSERMSFDMRLDRPPANSTVAPEDREEWAAEAFAAAILEAGGSLQPPPGTG